MILKNEKASRSDCGSSTRRITVDGLTETNAEEGTVKPRKTERKFASLQENAKPWPKVVE